MATDEVTIRPDGRWGGQLTSRPLPDDPSIDALSNEERENLGDVWIGRAASERRVGDAFVLVAGALRALGCGAALVELAERAIDDEMRHAELSRRIASRYAGADLTVSRLTLTVPQHRGADERLRHILHVVGHCCLNETIASGFLELTLAQTTAPLARAVLRELLSDEIDHARIGWGLLASLDEETRRRIEPWLLSMCIANLRMWREAPRPYVDNARLLIHGAPHANVVDEAALMALRELLIPGCETLGVAATPVQKWLEDGAPT